MGRNIRFSLKRFIFHNKTTLILTVLIFSIIFLLSQRPNDSRDRIQAILKRFHEPPPYSKVELDSLYYKFKLGVTETNRTKGIDGQCENEWMIAALPGTRIEDHLWEYLSLLAIEQTYGKQFGRKIHKFLSKRSITHLEQIFER